METRVEQPRKSWWIKYSPELKQAGVDRLLAGESATAIAKDLGIRRKLLYKWKDAGFGTNGMRRQPAQAATIDPTDPLQQQIARQQHKIAELERLTGQQAAELDFFAAALRAVKESRLKTDASSGGGSTQRSKP
jgi:transposase